MIDDYSISGNPDVALEGVANETFTDSLVTNMAIIVANIDTIVLVGQNGAQWSADTLANSQSAATSAAAALTYSNNAATSASAAAISAGNAAASAVSAAGSVTAAAASASAAAASAAAAAAVVASLDTNPRLLPPSGGNEGEILRWSGPQISGFPFWSPDTGGTPSLNFDGLQDVNVSGANVNDTVKFDGTNWVKATPAAATQFKNLSDVLWPVTPQDGDRPVFRTSDNKLHLEQLAANDPFLIPTLATIVGPASVTLTTADKGVRFLDITNGNITITWDELSLPANTDLGGLFIIIGAESGFKVTLVGGGTTGPIPAVQGSVGHVSLSVNASGTSISNAQNVAKTFTSLVPVGSLLAVLLVMALNPQGAVNAAFSPGYFWNGAGASTPWDYTMASAADVNPKFYAGVQFYPSVASIQSPTFKPDFVDFGGNPFTAAYHCDAIVLNNVDVADPIDFFRGDKWANPGGSGEARNVISEILGSLDANRLGIFFGARRSDIIAPGTASTFTGTGVTQLAEHGFNPGSANNANFRFAVASMVGAPGVSKTAVYNSTKDGAYSTGSLYMRPASTQIKLYVRGQTGSFSSIDVTTPSGWIGWLYNPSAKRVDFSL